MSDEVYFHPPTFDGLRNRLNIRDRGVLDRVERRFVTQRTGEPIPSGTFDLRHLKAIHRHLFQDIDDRAGELCAVEISKGGNQFRFRRFSENAIADVLRRLVARNFLHGLDAGTFAAEAAEIIGDVNHVHPFREGNGRTQMLYLVSLSRQAGCVLDLSAIGAERWMAASRRAHLANYGAMAGCIAGAIRPACAPMTRPT